MSFIGVVLAGGQSTRMGTDKALLKANGKTMLYHLSDLLFSCGATQVVVSRNCTDSQDIPDIYPGCGPLSGIQAVCSRFPEAALLFVPVDLPLLCEQDLLPLIEAGKQARCLARFKGNNLPLYVNNNRLLTLTLTRQLAQGQGFSVGNFCTQFPMVEVSTGNTLALYNSNTPKQWIFALSKLNSMNTLATGREI